MNTTKIQLTRLDPAPAIQVEVSNPRLLFVAYRDSASEPNIQALKAYASQTLAVYVKTLLDNKGLTGSADPRHAFVQDCLEFAAVLDLPELFETFCRIESFRTKFADKLDSHPVLARQVYVALIEDLRELPGQEKIDPVVRRTASLYIEAAALGFDVIPNLTSDGQPSSAQVLLRRLEDCIPYVTLGLTQNESTSPEYQAAAELVNFINKVGFSDIHRAIAVTAELPGYSLRTHA